MKNYFYTNDISNKIKELLDKELPEEAALNISIGDFTVLPAPEKLEGYLPAVLINLSSQEVIDSNIALEVFTQQYTFDIYYVYPYSLKEFEDTPGKAIDCSEIISNALMNNRTLRDMQVPKSSDEAGGQVITSYVSKIDYDNAETKLFRSLSIPAHITHIEYCLVFRTFRR